MDSHDKVTQKNSELGGRSGNRRHTDKDRIVTDTVENHRRVKKETVPNDDTTHLFFTDSGR
jgi:hypothetical protein